MPRRTPGPTGPSPRRLGQRHVAVAGRGRDLRALPRITSAGPQAQHRLLDVAQHHQVAAARPAPGRAGPPGRRRARRPGLGLRDGFEEPAAEPAHAQGGEPREGHVPAVRDLQEFIGQRARHRFQYGRLASGAGVWNGPEGSQHHLQQPVDHGAEFVRVLGRLFEAVDGAGEDPGDLPGRKRFRWSLRTQGGRGCPPTRPRRLRWPGRWPPWRR